MKKEKLSERIELVARQRAAGIPGVTAKLPPRPQTPNEVHADKRQQASPARPLMETVMLSNPEIAAGDVKSATEVTDKKGFAARWKFSVRHIDNLLAQGLPHYKIGKRRVRIFIAEADAWMKARFGVQRRRAV